MSSGQLFIADSGLQSLNGHNAAAMQALAATCGSENIEFFCHQHPDPAVRAEALQRSVRLTPFFSDSFYGAYDTPGTLTDLNRFINSLAADYARLFDRLVRLHGGGTILHHTMDWPHLLALGLANGAEAYPELRHLVFLMFSPGLAADGSILNQWRSLNFRLGLGRLTQQANVRLFASCHEHEVAYRTLYPEYRDPSIHPIFFSASPPPEGSAIGADHGDELRCSFRSQRILLYLGDAKVDKGFCRLPALVRALLPFLDQRSTLVVHYNLNDALASPRLRDTAQSIEAMVSQDARLRIVRGFLSDDHLSELIAGCDVALFDYDPGTYAHKTSGLLWQVCRCETPLVLLGESWLSREARRLHPWVRVHASLTDLQAELAGRGAVVFTRNVHDEAYRTTLFSPFGEFIKAQSVTPLPSGHERARPISAPRHRSPWRRHALMVDLNPPGSEKSGGGHAAIQEARMLETIGFDVSFASPDGMSGRPEAAVTGISYGPEPALRTLKDRGAEFDLVYITRFHVAKPLIRDVRLFAPRAKLVLNVADLHFLRELRKAALEPDASRVSYAELIREQELAVLEQVDLVLCYTETERAVIESHLGVRARVARCPWVEEVRAAVPGYELRRDVAFLGGYGHAPNVDAVQWFVEQVMPVMRTLAPGVRFLIYGSDPSAEVRKLASDDVVIKGFVDQVADAFDACRVFVAPLRYGAGFKAKVAAALAHGVPCVLSRIAAEGVVYDDDTPLSIAETPEEWAAAILQYYHDASQWTAASHAARAYAKRRFLFGAGARRLSAALSALSPDLVR